MSVACASAHVRTHTYADALTRGVRVWSNIHPFTTTNKMPIIQAAHAAELSPAKPRTQGEMNNKTPRTTERYSEIQAALTKASATSARITPITPIIHASQERAPSIPVPKTHRLLKS